MYKKIAVKTWTVILVLLLVMSSAFSVYATEQTQQGPCTIEVITKDDKGNYYGGFEVALFKVAEVREDGNYYIIDDFKDAGYTIQQFLQEEITETICKKLRNHALNKELAPVGILVTDAEGKTEFKNMDKGIYLFINTGRTDAASNFYEFIPGVVFAPVLGQTGTINYTSKAFPKIEKLVENKPTPTPIPDDKPPQTGDTSNIELWRTLMYSSMGGIVVFGTFAIICGKKEEEEDWA